MPDGCRRGMSGIGMPDLLDLAAGVGCQAQECLTYLAPCLTAAAWDVRHRNA